MQTYKLYSDGNYFPRAKKSGFGGYIQSPSGEILVEYTEQIKSFEHIYSFELLGIIRGLTIAKDKGIESIISYCDDKNTTLKLKEIFEDQIFNIPHSMKPELYQQVIDLSKAFKKIQFEYIPRTENKYADSLSRKYATMMENNFLKQYEQELHASAINLTKTIPPKKRIFFSHHNMVPVLHKNNPFLVAQHRNKKVRKVSKEQQQLPYVYIFTEMFKKEDTLMVHQTIYDKDWSILLEQSQTSQGHQPLITEYCNFLVDILQHPYLKNTQNVWIDSNYRHINNIFEQKEKLNYDYWTDYQNLHKAITPFSKVFFNRFPFEPKYQPENINTEIVKKNLEKNIESLESLFSKFENGILTKDKNKHFGAIIRYHLKQYRDTLQRDLSDIEKNQIIQQTVSNLKKIGVSQLPK